jgi:hypothetical protein
LGKMVPCTLSLPPLSSPLQGKSSFINGDMGGFLPLGPLWIFKMAGRGLPPGRDESGTKEKMLCDLDGQPQAVCGASRSGLMHLAGGKLRNVMSPPFPAKPTLSTGTAAPIPVIFTCGFHGCEQSSLLSSEPQLHLLPTASHIAL